MADGFNNRPSVAQQLTDNIVGGNAAGIISTRPTAKYASGARCILKINDKIVGFAFGVSWRILTNFVEVTTIDDYLPYELAPQRVSVEGTISALHIPGQSSTTELWQGDTLSFMFNRYFTLEVRDSQTDALLFQAPRCVITSRTEEVRVDQLNNVSLSWKAIGWLDEKKPELPNNFDQPKKPSAASTSNQGGIAGTLGNIANAIRGFNIP